MLHGSNGSLISGSCQLWIETRNAVPAGRLGMNDVTTGRGGCWVRGSKSFSQFEQLGEIDLRRGETCLSPG